MKAKSVCLQRDYGSQHKRNSAGEINTIKCNLQIFTAEKCEYCDA